MEHKTLKFMVQEKRADGGRIIISTPAVDRDRDRVFPMGARIEAYLDNPVVQFAHRYTEPWATVGRTTSLEVTPGGIVADFELRPAANDSDPQNIVRLLWEGNWLRTASIGFNPIAWQENDVGGKDYTDFELLEWSLCPVPSQQNALRLAAKALEGGDTKPLQGGDYGLTLLERDLLIDRLEEFMAAVKTALRLP